jgi:DNA-binding NarL/FixJ family response regulator
LKYLKGEDTKKIAEQMKLSPLTIKKYYSLYKDFCLKNPSDHWTIKTKNDRSDNHE